MPLPSLLNKSCCRVCESFAGPIPGVGPRPARVMFLGEGPGKDEDRYRYPFVETAQTGKEFTQTYLPLSGLRREDVYITNASKCVFPGFRNPTKEEAQSCAKHHLAQELKDVNPEVVVAMGAVAISVFRPDFDIEMDYGFPFETTYGDWTGTVFPVYHPAIGLHNQDFMNQLFEGFRRLKLYLEWLDNPASVLGPTSLVWPEDQYPSPNYVKVTSPRFLETLLSCHTSPGTECAIDTEYDPKKTQVSAQSDTGRWFNFSRKIPYCMTFSVQPGEGYLIMADQADCLAVFADWNQSIRPLVLMHNCLADLTPIEILDIEVDPRRLIDTMAMAYHMYSLPQGLKTLAHRLCGMAMSTFTDTVMPYALPIMHRWFYDSLGLLNEAVEELQVKTRTFKNGKAPVTSYKLAKRPDCPPEYPPARVKVRNLLDSWNTCDVLKRIKGWDKDDPLPTTLPLLESLTGREYPRPNVTVLPPDVLLHYACLHGESLINTETGLRKIKDLVKLKYTGNVWGVHPDSGEPVLRPVTGWYRIQEKSPIAWTSVVTKHTLKGRWGYMATRYTPDHKLLTRDGMQPVSALTPGTEIATPYKALDSVQYQVVLGSLLGDGNLSCRNEDGWAYLRIIHCSAQALYLKWKQSLLGDLAPTPVYHVLKEGPGDYYGFSTVVHPQLLDLEEDTYYLPGRRSPGSWLKDLEPLGLAIAIQDNGTRTGDTVRIYLPFGWGDLNTQSFVTLLASKFGIHSTYYCPRPGQFAIHIATKSMERLKSLVIPYIHPCMIYKFGDVTPAMEPVNRVLKGMFFSKVGLVQSNPVSPGRRGGVCTSYCIDVAEIHNFFTPYEVAKNCRDADATLRVYHALRRLQYPFRTGPFRR